MMAMHRSCGGLVKASQGKYCRKLPPGRIFGLGFKPHKIHYRVRNNDPCRAVSNELGLPTPCGETLCRCRAAGYDL